MIPPDILGSAIQAGAVQREAARAQDAERAGTSNAARTQTRAVDEAAASVETGDSDAQVYTDAEGAGSQGRSSMNDGQTGGESAEEDLENALIAENPTHLDIRA